MSTMSAAQMSALLREAAAEGLTEAAEYVQKVTRERTPDDPATGGDDLVGSLTVDPATPDDLTATVYTNAEHAVYQHEALDIAHPTGQSKYLETGTLDSRAEVERIVGAAVRQRLG